MNAFLVARYHCLHGELWDRQGETLQVARMKLWLKFVPMSKKAIFEKDQGFFSVVLSQKYLDTADM